MSKATEILNLFERNEYTSNPFVISLVDDITETAFVNIIMSNDIDESVDNQLKKLKKITEAVEGVPSGAKVFFGRVVKGGKLLGKIKKGKFIPFEKKDNEVSDEDIDKAPASVKNVFKKMKKHIVGVANDLQVGTVEVATALAEKNTMGFLKAVGHSIDTAAKVTHGSVKAISKGAAQGIQELDKAGAFDKLKEGTVKGVKKAVELAKKHPKAAKVMGGIATAAIGTSMINSALNGDDDFVNWDEDVNNWAPEEDGWKPAYDTNLDNNLASSMGNVATSMAAGTVASLAIGATALGPIAGLAAVYMGAKKLKNSGLAKKAQESIIKKLSSKAKSVKVDGVPEDSKVVMNTVLKDGKVEGKLKDGKYISESKSKSAKLLENIQSLRA